MRMNTVPAMQRGALSDTPPQLAAIMTKAVPMISDSSTNALLLKPPGTSIDLLVINIFNVYFL